MPSVNQATFRDHAANERTVLAWIRTGVALMAFGFAIARFGLFLREMAEVRGGGAPPTTIGSQWFGAAMVVLGLLTNVAATIRYTRIKKAIDEGRTIAMSVALVYVVGFGSVLVALLMTAILSRTF
jgi:putative membrane protein